MYETLQIETGKTLTYENVASFRTKMKESEIQIELERFISFFEEKGLKKNGHMISATFGVEIINQEQVIDVEFLIPIVKKIPHPDKYRIKELFHLVNAVYTRYIGDHQKVQDAQNSILNYVRDKQLIPISAIYTVHINEEDASNGLQNSFFDIYIGVNPSIL